jgi:tripartite ATP-independent transporter DctM subunit
MELTNLQIGWLMIALAFGAMFMGFPVAVTMIMAGFVGMWLIRGVDPALGLLGWQSWRQSLNQVLVIIPLYTWMGALAGKGGIGEDAFIPLSKWVGQFRGGLAMAVATATAGFSAISGNHIACAVAMSRVTFPEMRKYKYDDGFSLATIAASANLDIMIPPSGSFILYGFLTDTPIPALFIAGILPGLFMWALIMIQIAVQVRINPSLGPAAARVGWIDRLKSTYLLWPLVLVFVIVLGGIYTGIFTATEAACVGCFLMMVISAARRRLSVKGIIQSLQQTLPTSAMIMLMLIGGWIFGSTLTSSGLPQALSGYIIGSGLSPYAVMALILVVYIIAGCITDIFAVLVITLPVFWPILCLPPPLGLGFSSLHFGVLCVAAIMAGSISPPFAILAFALNSQHRDVPVTTIFRSSIPFLVTVIVSMVALMFLPQLSTFLACNAHLIECP